MLDVLLPLDAAVPRLTRAFACCLVSALELPPEQFPVYRAELPTAIGRWRTWLAGRGLGLVPVARPEGFNWPGYWIATLNPSSLTSSTSVDQTAVLMFGTPAGVVLSPDDGSLLGRAAADLPVRNGYVLAGFDPAITVGDVDLPHLRGRIEAIAVADTATGPMRLLATARALAGRGLEGDRYAARAGTFTPAGGVGVGVGYDLTLIEAEAFDEVHVEPPLGFADARRNLVTRGIDLNALVGRTFRVGDVECLGQRLCEPCAHLERLTTTGVLRALIHRGGLRADILTGGTIDVGAVIETMESRGRRRR